MGSLSLEAVRFRKNVGTPTASTLPPMAMMALTSTVVNGRMASVLVDVGFPGEGSSGKPSSAARAGKLQFP